MKINFIFMLLAVFFHLLSCKTINNTSLINKPDAEKFAFVEGGAFQMGDVLDIGQPNEKPVHKAVVSDFFIGKYEVTQKEWTLIMKNNPSRHPENEDQPVESVTWYECIEYCNKRSIKEGLFPYYKINKSKKDLNNNNQNDKYRWTVEIIKDANGYRLPTEAEWEFAARGGLKSMGYKFSGSNDGNEVAVFSQNCPEIRPMPVGSKKPNEIGIYDMSGNVREWCWDWYGVYSSGEENNPAGPVSGTNRVIRGAEFRAYENALNVSMRDEYLPRNKYHNTGFRLARGK